MNQRVNWKRGDFQLVSECGNFTVIRDGKGEYPWTVKVGQFPHSRWSGILFKTQRDAKDWCSTTQARNRAVEVNARRPCPPAEGGRRG